MSYGFIGLGVMGEPICRNMMQKSGADFMVSDLSEAPVQRLAALGATPATLAQAARADVLFLSLPGGPQLEQVMGQVLDHGRAGLTVVDMTTAPVALTRRLAAAAAERGMSYADAPVARTRAAAENGTLSIMVGASDQVFARIRPMLDHAASDVTHCGGVGCGQVAKLLNNMVLFETVSALAEALAMGEAAGMDGALLFDVLSKGSADSFALRNHGMKAMLPRDFPQGAFPTDYALKDVAYALELAADTGTDAPGAELARAKMQAASDAGFGAEYFPVMSRLTRRG